MARIEIVKSLKNEIFRKFKAESKKILTLISSLSDNPHKGKLLGSVGGITIKELKYKGFRLYFLVDGHKLKFLSQEELTDLLIRFVRISDKKHQQGVINEIKHILRTIGEGEF